MPDSVRQPAEAPWARRAEQVLKDLNVSSREGLAEATVRKRRHRHGANRLKQKRKRPAAVILLDQVKNVIILLLAVAAGASLAFGQHLEAAAIVVAIVLNVAIGFFTELRATRSMEALQRLGKTEARVRRRGRVRSVPARELVPGDIVLLEGGRPGHHGDRRPSGHGGQSGPPGGIAEAEDPEVVQGRDLKGPGEVSPEEQRELLQRRVFARVSPKQKLDLIGLHQDGGAVVAMTGDGVNDAPALKKADIGIAMGRRGTQVAREAADMVLQDDAFGTIVTAVAQGRAIFENIRKFILFLLSGNVGEILIVGVAILAGSPLPLLPLQILYLNMIGDVFPALALAAGGEEQGRMREPPRDAGEPILTRSHWTAIGAYGALIAAAVLAAFWIARSPLGLAPERAVTVSFLCLSFARLWHVFNMRSPQSGAVVNDITRNAYVWGALVLCTVLLLTAVYLPGLSGVLKLAAPRPFEWILVLSFSIVPLVAGQAFLALLPRFAT